MAALPPERARQGFWTDHTHGQVRGATITTTSSCANLVIALLSVLVTFTGSHLWDLIAFTYFWIVASKKSRGALHHQVQILARNITSPGAFLLEVTLVAWAWRKNGNIFSLAFVAILAFFCSAGFIVAGVFVSQIVSTSGLQVLARSKHCGLLSWRNTSSDENLSYGTMAYSEASAYASNCYNRTDRPSVCNVYVKQAVPIQETRHTGCPFPGTCLTKSALRLDTGLLDSSDVFGINADSDHRIKIQRIFTCAPIDADAYNSTRPMPVGYVRKFENRDALPGEQLFTWSFGELAFVSPINATAWQSNYTAKFRTGIDLTPRTYYTPASGDDLTGWYNSTFIPVPELQREDADTHIIMFQNNGLRYYAPNDDPILAAHQRVQVPMDDGQPRVMYTADKVATFLACAEQMRVCFARGTCTPLLGARSAYSRARKIAPTAEQSATFHYLFLQSATFYDVARAPMIATRNADSFELAVPPNQWEIEVRAWVQFILAMTQTTMTHVAAGPGIVRSDFDALAEPLDWPGLCHMQRMGAPNGYSNINVLALALVVAPCGIIILINLTLLPTLKYLRQRDSGSIEVMSSWRRSGILQVQRIAYEGAGYVRWLCRDSTVPKPEGELCLPAFDSEDFVASLEVGQQRDLAASSPHSSDPVFEKSHTMGSPPPALIKSGTV